MPADELTATCSTAGSATAIPAATDRVRLATMESAETAAATTTARRETETIYAVADGDSICCRSGWQRRNCLAG